MRKLLFASYQFFLKKHPKKTLAGFALLALFYWFLLPYPLFKVAYSTVMEDRQGALLGARIATDGQWRFPMIDTVPQKFADAIITFEDKRFFYHPGVDLISLSRALIQNIRHWEVVSGASTLSMQVIRMARRNKKRTFLEKAVEMVLATRLELGYSKEDILRLYASHAPFGGNTVGIETASWRYFGKSPKLLSWAEAAMLAVLPNSPALIHPGRNRNKLLEKRNSLLNKLFQKEYFDKLTLDLAKEEPLPQAPLPLPQLAPHLLDRMQPSKINAQNKDAAKFQSTLQLELQQNVTNILKRRQKLLSHNGIHNIAALVLEVESGNVLAYVGNVIGAGKNQSEQVDIISSSRSTGSILKPFLYAFAIQEGIIFPNSLLPDIPTQISGYHPENFNKRYDGAVPANKALIRSLNIPMVRLLQQYGLEKFHYRLKQLGLTTINYPPEHYGLTLILGGAEGSLWEISNAYACMARTLNHIYPFNGQYDPNDFRAANFLFSNKTTPNTSQNLSNSPPLLSAAAIWSTFETIKNVERPNTEGEWELFQSSKKIAWKTGTSYGFRDAWAIGVTPDHVVGVWTGNADGEGRAGLIGIYAAAPTLFDIFDLLPQSEWFVPPYDELEQLAICKESGYRALPICNADTLWVPSGGLNVKACPFHQVIHLDQSRKWQVNRSCESSDQIVQENRFVLPPVQAYYFKSKDPQYKPLPPFREDCSSEAQEKERASMQLIYPKNGAKLYVPTNLDGTTSKTVFTVAHRQPETTIYWHLGEKYLGKTKEFHNFEMSPPEGKHVLTLVDEAGNRLQQSFEIIGKPGK